MGRVQYFGVFGDVLCCEFLAVLSDDSDCRGWYGDIHIYIIIYNYIYIIIYNYIYNVYI